MFNQTEFTSIGVTLRGRLYRPAPKAGTAPGLVMAHGFSGTVGMVVDKYAEAFSDAGFVVLLYDHAGFGDSDGEPRLEINPWIQAHGYLDALAHLRTVPGVDRARIALWGDSLAGGYVVALGSIADHVAAVVAHVPVIGPVPPPEDPKGELFAALRQTLLKGEFDGPADRIGPRPVVSTDQIGTPSLLKPLTAYRWMIEYGSRFGSGWVNQVTRVLPHTPVHFHPGLCAPQLTVPSLWVVAPEDEMAAANPDVTRQAFEAASGAKEWLEIDGGHFGLMYFPSPLFDTAVQAETDFLTRILRP